MAGEERQPWEQPEAQVDSHVLMALAAALELYGDRQLAEDYVRNRLVWASDTWPDVVELRAELSRQRVERLAQAIGLPVTAVEALGDQAAERRRRSATVHGRNSDGRSEQ